MLARPNAHGARRRRVKQVVSGRVAFVGWLGPSCTVPSTGQVDGGRRTACLDDAPRRADRARHDPRPPFWTSFKERINKIGRDRCGDG